MERETCNICGEVYYIYTEGNKDADDKKDEYEKHIKECVGFWNLDMKGRKIFYKSDFICKNTKELLNLLKKINGMRKYNPNLKVNHSIILDESGGLALSKST